MKAYLAGPEVFLPNARAVLDQKIELTRRYGFTPVAPGDLEIPATESKKARGLAISAIDERLMLSSDLIIANLTPFRGISADVGTAFELGFMCARGCPAFAFSNSVKSHFDRARSYYRGAVQIDSGGQHRGADGLAIEDFEMIDNLMLHGAVEARDGIIVTRDVDPDRIFLDLTAFEECLAIAARKLLGR